MDFFQFLQNSKNNNDTKVKKTQDKNSKVKNISCKPTESEVTKATINTNDNNNSLYKNIRKGNFVRILHLKNSPLNAYKGYIGEIKDYKYGQDYAIVFLHGINCLTFVKFPLDHFTLIE
jgi:hypothetical protein